MGKWIPNTNELRNCLWCGIIVRRRSLYCCRQHRRNAQKHEVRGTVGQKLGRICLGCGDAISFGKPTSAQSCSERCREKWRKRECQRLVEELKRGGCRVTGCLEKRIPCLDCHHLDPEEKSAMISTLVSRGQLGALRRELKKCWIVCANCHRMIHFLANSE